MSAWWTQSRQRILLAILPFLVAASGGCKPAVQTWPIWEKYAARFISPEGRVIDPMRDSITTSEGQSYALFFALVSNDRARFDLLLKWTQDNLAAGSLNAHLPGWMWGKTKEGRWGMLDKGQAADSDCWIAYSLIEAGRLWQNDHYSQIGRAMMKRIAEDEVEDIPGFGPLLMPGPSENFIHIQAYAGQTHTEQIYTLNPSYMPHFLIARFAAIDPTGPWSAVAANIPRFLKQSARGGYAMDWVTYTPGTGFKPASGPAPPDPTKPAPPAFGSYDAIRVYLWAGMENPAGTARSDLLAAVSGMAGYLANHGAPPEKVSDEGIPILQDGPVGFSAAMLPYLRALPQLSKSAMQQKQRIDAQLDPATGLYGKDPAYYDQNLILFASGFDQKKFTFSPDGELKVQWTY
jgi:endo-1,4-beta-D-glucanase Y